MEEIISSVASALRVSVGREWPYDEDNCGHENLLIFELAYALRSRGYSCWPEVTYSDSSERLDLLAINEDHGIAVEGKMLKAGTAQMVAKDAAKLGRFSPRGWWQPSDKPIRQMLLVGAWLDEETRVDKWWRDPTDQGPADCRPEDPGWMALRVALKGFERREAVRAYPGAADGDKNLWVLWAIHDPKVEG